MPRVAFGILASLLLASTLHGQGGRVETVARWDFGVEEDVKGDRWPDDWSRRTGTEYPKYLAIGIYKRTTTKKEIEEIDKLRRLYSQWSLAWDTKQLPWNITPETTPREFDKFVELTVINPFLEFQMDGGAAEVASPYIAIENQSVYGISCHAFADCNSQDFEGFATIRFYDASKRFLFERSTPSITGRESWKELSSLTQYPYNPDVAYAQVSLQVRPRSARSFRAVFGFDSVRILRSPRLSLKVDRPSRLYRQDESVVVECKASGMNYLQSTLDIRLTDHDGKTIGRVTKSLIPEDSGIQPAGRLIQTGTKSLVPAAYWSGNCQWKLPKLEAGFYEVRTQMDRSRTDRFELIERFAVLSDHSGDTVNMQVGWSIPEDRQREKERLATSSLVDILREARVSRVKLPIWFDSRDNTNEDFYTDRVDRIQGAGIACVGVIATPPESLKSMYVRSRAEDSGSALEETMVTQTLLEPVLQRMSSRLLNFQLGWDHEADFVAHTRFQTALDSIRRMFRRYSQEAQLIASHNPMAAWSSTPSIDRWQLNCATLLTADELKTILLKSQAERSPELTPWFHITPLSSKLYSLRTRVQDLTERMLLLTDPRFQSNTVGWVYDPMTSDVGMITEDGGPREMFVPFRTLSASTEGMQYLGKLPNSQLGQNAVLSSNDRCRLLIWGPQPLHAKLYLGKKISIRDVWGRIIPYTTEESRLGPVQSFSVGDWPVIVDGVDIYTARWRMGLEVLTKQIDMVVGKQEEILVQFANPFPFPVSGSMQIVCSSLVDDQPAKSFRVDSEGQEKISIPVKVNPYANTGNSPMQIIVTLEGPEDQSIIAIDENIQIGSNEIEFDLRYTFTETNELLVEIEANNRSGVLANFDCILQPSSRTRERTQILQLKDRTTRFFVLPRADELVGQTLLLQCEQIGTNRVFNMRTQVNRL
jgi:hypothetical protein